MQAHSLTPAVVAGLRDALLAWYDASGRALPWRSTRDPYAIWVSEVMSQQTRVETVIPYYERWLHRFPDLASLADAAVDDVLKQWEGLGYYSRARNMHSAARIIRERHGAALPGTYDELRALPGVGDYTAGAVSSIAFGVAAPAVDGNVRRVLARLLDDPAPSQAALRHIAAMLVPLERPGDFNQSIMELGATLCTPRAPRCERCPVSRWCAAYAAGTQADRPRTTKKPPVPRIPVATAVLRAPDQRVMLVRRPPTGLLAGLWTFPGRELVQDDSAVDVIVDIARSFGTPTGEPQELCVIEHAFSHRRERYICCVVDVTDVRQRDDTVWIGVDRAGITLSRAQQRIHAAAIEVGRT